MAIDRRFIPSAYLKKKSTRSFGKDVDILKIVEDSIISGEIDISDAPVITSLISEGGLYSGSGTLTDKPTTVDGDGGVLELSNLLGFNVISEWVDIDASDGINIAIQSTDSEDTLQLSVSLLIDDGENTLEEYAELSIGSYDQDNLKLSKTTMYNNGVDTIDGEAYLLLGIAANDETIDGPLFELYGRAEDGRLSGQSSTNARIQAVTSIDGDNLHSDMIITSDYLVLNNIVSFIKNITAFSETTDGSGQCIITFDPGFSLVGIVLYGALIQFSGSTPYVTTIDDVNSTTGEITINVFDMAGDPVITTSIEGVAFGLYLTAL